MTVFTFGGIKMRILLFIAALGIGMVSNLTLGVCLAEQKSPLAVSVSFTGLQDAGKLNQVEDLFWSESQKRLLVSDTGGNRLLFFGDSDGSFKFLWEFKPEGMALPISAVETRHGKLVVIERGVPGVVIYDPQTGEKRSALTAGFPDATTFSPVCLSLDDKDNLYVVDQGNRRIYVFDEKLAYQCHIAPPTPESKGYASVTVDKRGSIIALEAVHGAVLVFSSEGKLVRQVSKRGDSRGGTEFPVDVAVNPQGVLYILDSHGHRLALFDRNGTFQGYIGEKGWKEGQLIFPSRIEVAPDYRLFVVDDDNCRLQVFVPAQRQ